MRFYQGNLFRVGKKECGAVRLLHCPASRPNLGTGATKPNFETRPRAQPKKRKKSPKGTWWQGSKGLSDDDSSREGTNAYSEDDTRGAAIGEGKERAHQATRSLPIAPSPRPPPRAADNPPSCLAQYTPRGSGLPEKPDTVGTPRF